MKKNKSFMEKVNTAKYQDIVLNEFLIVLFVEMVVLIPVAFVMGFALVGSALCLMALLVAFMDILVNFHKNFRSVAVVVIGFVNCLIAPLLLIMCGGLYNVAPICFAISLIMIYSVFEGREFYIFLFICLFEYFYLYKDVLLSTGDVALSEPVLAQFGFYLLYILATLFFVLFVAIIQEWVYRGQRVTIRRHNEQIHRTENARRQFLSSMSKEVRSPMNSLIGFSELLLKQDLDDEMRAEVNTLRTASYDLLSIIDDVLTYAKIDAGEMHINAEEYQPEELVQEILHSISEDLLKKNLYLDVRLAHDIPKTLCGDKSLIRQIFLYLLFISIDNTSNGRIIMEIGCRPEEDGKCRLMCQVADTGRGLSAVDVDTLFATYDRYDSRQSSNLKGIGLKFTICKELLAMMQGSIEVQSIDGVGLCTSFNLVNDIVDAAPMIALDAEKRQRVLLYATDESDMQRLQNILDGFRVRTDYVRSYPAFNSILQERKFDYIFLTESVYENVSNIISLYQVEENTYVVGDYNSAYGDYGKCRLIRKPFSDIDLQTILNGHWNKEDYQRDKNKSTFTAKKARVLVVDDNAVNLKVAAGIFKKYGIDIALATSGEDALKKIEAEKYDLILMDMAMPDKNGDEVLQEIRAKEDKYYKEVPVIALTAQNGANVREEIMAAGFQEYLAKPIKRRYLEDCLLRFLPEDLIVKVTVTDSGKPAKKEESAPAQKSESGLNTDKGLMNIGFNKDAYAAILNTYYTEGLKYVDQLPQLLEVGDIRLFTTNVHGIKSSSASIGAMEVSDLFRELEFAGKAENMDEIHEKFTPYLEKFKEMLEIVKKYLVDNNQFEAQQEEADLEDMEVEELSMESLNDFKTELDKMNLKVCDAWIADAAGRNFGPEINKDIHAMKEAYEMFDFHQVKQVLQETMAKISSFMADS